MRLLLDTDIMIGLSKGDLAARAPAAAGVIEKRGHGLFVSVAGLWEIAIKTRLGKLATFFEAVGITILPIRRRSR